MHCFNSDLVLSLPSMRLYDGIAFARQYHAWDSHTFHLIAKNIEILRFVLHFASILTYFL